MGKGPAPAMVKQMNSRILLIEDEPGLVVTVSDLLSAEGHEVESATNGETGFAKAVTGAFDLIILDVMLPRKMGFDVCRELRQSGVDTVILMLTARVQVMDRVIGLRLGADDYLTKPFDPAELLARVEALLRRVRKTVPIPVRTFQFGDVEADFERAEVRKCGRSVSMAAKELQLLRYLVDHRERVVSRAEIMHEVWEYSKEVSSRTVDVHVAWLRQKLEDCPQSPKHIQTIRGRGYRFTA
jgi:two-component system alkaline phosphatase synthesis response regulator PhoP